MCLSFPCYHTLRYNSIIVRGSDAATGGFCSMQRTNILDVAGHPVKDRMWVVDICYFSLSKVSRTSLMRSLYPDVIPHLVNTGTSVFRRCRSIDALYVGMVSVYQVGWCCRSRRVFLWSYVIPVHCFHDQAVFLLQCASW